jgi:hypothetical protein
MKKRKCNFCQKTEEEIETLIINTEKKRIVGICNQCVLACNDVLIRKYIGKINKNALPPKE